MSRPAARRISALGAFLLLVPACKKDEIAVYRVPKDAPPALAPAMGGGMPGMETSAPGHPGISWTVPKGWREQAASGMRAGSFLAPGAGGKDVDVSVVPLGGDAGGELANVNRWRGQLGLAPVDEAGLTGIVTSQTIGGHAVRVVEFANADGKRLLAVVLRNASTTYFFKASGDDAAVKSIKPAFLAFVGSAKFDRHE